MPYLISGHILYTEAAAYQNKNLPKLILLDSLVQMLPPECSNLLMEEYMNNTEDAQTLQIQYKEMIADFLFVIPALQVAKFQREYICDEA